MAKRKRLTLPHLAETPGLAEPAAESLPAPSRAEALFPMGVSRSSAPISWVAGEASAVAALSDLAGEVALARDGGRMIEALPLSAVEGDYLVRDRMVADEAELETLMQSLRARGQQMPIEVTPLPGGRYGLISGWRRLTALRRLQAEAPEERRFASVLAILRHPEAASEAYLAMVEENEIRVGLSYYERARIVARAAEQGVFPDAAAALSRLFAAASRAKRSKIGSFLRIVAALDDRLRFASHIPERLGLALARRLEADAAFTTRLRDRLRKTPAETAEAELALLERALTAPKQPPAPSAGPAPDGPLPEAAPPAPAAETVSVPARPMPPFPLPGTEEIPGVWVEGGLGVLTLRGPGVTAHFQMQLIRLLAQFRD